MESNTTADDIPAWINNDLLQEVLSQNVDTGLSIISVDAKAALQKGENYLSVLYRLVVKYVKDNDENNIIKCQLMLKTLPLGEILRKFLSEAKGFEKELQMYVTTLPAIHRILKEKSANGKFRPFSAQCFPTQRPNVIILEDMQPLGYKMANRHNGLDLDHARLTVRALARLHAASLALHKSDPSSMDRYGEGFYLEERKENISTQLSTNIGIIVSNVEKWPGYEHYAEKIRALIPTIAERLIKIVEPNKNSVNVLNHGDCWVNNMMFRYSDSGRVEDIRFVDFQISRFSSPALDLQYFLCSSLHDDIRFKYRDQLLNEYHSEFVDVMKILGLDPEKLTLQQLKKEFDEKEFFGFITTCLVLVVVVGEKDDVPNFKDITQEDVDEGATPMEKLYAGKRYREVFQTWLPYFDGKGIFK